MPEGIIFGVDRPFVEDVEKTIKFIIEFSDSATEKDIRQSIQHSVSEIEDLDHIINDVIVDEGVAPLVMMEMATTNMEYENINNIRDVLVDMDNFKGMTVSTVNLGQIDRFARKR